MPLWLLVKLSSALKTRASSEVPAVSSDREWHGDSIIPVSVNVIAGHHARRALTSCHGTLKTERAARRATPCPQLSSGANMGEKKKNGDNKDSHESPRARSDVQHCAQHGCDECALLGAAAPQDAMQRCPTCSMLLSMCTASYVSQTSQRSCSPRMQPCNTEP